MSQPLEVPDLVRRRVSAAGAAGQRWMEQLPEVVARLAEDWRIEVGRVLEGGTAAFVAEAVGEDGRPCVLKVALPLAMDDEDTFSRAVAVHRLAAGRGCAELLAYDEATKAMLLERLGPNLAALGMPLPEVLETIAATLRSFWRPVPDEIDLPTGSDKAAWLAWFITTTWEDLERPCPRRVVDRAVAYCDERAAAFDADAAVLVHGDAHGWNTLQAGPGFKLVDPEGLRSEPAHDLAVPMREYNEPLLDGPLPTSTMVRQRAELLGSLCDVDPEAIWQWGFIERVSTGLVCMQQIDAAHGRGFLEVAARSS